MTAQTNPQEDHHQEEDTLSFCDLPLYNTHNSSIIDTHETSINEPFEFLPSKIPSQLETNHVIFCGKLIPTGDHSYTHKNKKEYLPLYLRRTKGSLVAKTEPNHGGLSRGGSGKRGSSRFKWLSLVFGLQRYSPPKSVDMADMRSRLNAKSPRTLEEILEKSSSHNSSNGFGGNGKLENGLSRLIRSLSCTGPNSISVLN